MNCLVRSLERFNHVSIERTKKERKNCRYILSREIDVILTKSRSRLIIQQLFYKDDVCYLMKRRYDHIKET